MESGYLTKSMVRATVVPLPMTTTLMGSMNKEGKMGKANSLHPPSSIQVDGRTTSTISLEC